MKIIFEKNKRPLTEFSKRVIVAMTVAWFIGMLVGVIVVLVQTFRGDFPALEALLVFIGAPMTGGIIAYMAKSAFENVPKIKKGRNAHDEIFEQINEP